MARVAPSPQKGAHKALLDADGEMPSPMPRRPSGGGGKSVAPMPQLSNDSRTAAPPQKASSSSGGIGGGGSRTEEEKEEMSQAMAAGQNVKPEGVWVLDPQSNFCRNWDMFIILLMFFTALVTPVEVALIEAAPVSLFVLNRFVDLGFIVDMGFNFVLGFLDRETNCVVYDRVRIAKHYLAGWFLLDLVSVLPYDMAGELFKSDDIAQLKVLRVLRLLRLIKLLRVLRAARILKRLEHQLGLSFVTQSLIKLLLAIIFLIHWIACLWCLIPQFAGDAATSWVDTADYRYSADYRHWTEFYVLGLEFSLMSLVIGYGTVEPSSTFERSVANACFFICGAFYAYAIGAIYEAVQGRNPVGQAYEQSMDLLNMLMEEIRLPPSSRVKARQYFANCRTLQAQEYYQEVLQYMSPSLRGMITVHSHGAWIRTVPFFSAGKGDEKDRFTVQVALALKRQAFCANELVYKTGDRADRFFIVQQGMVARDGRVLRKGLFFGVDMITKGGRRSTSARCLTFTDCQALYKEDLQRILENGDFPLTTRAIHIEALRVSMKRYFKLIVKEMRTARMLSGGDGKDDKMTQEEIDGWVANMTAVADGKHRSSSATSQFFFGKDSLKAVEAEAAANAEEKEIEAAKKDGSAPKAEPVNFLEIYHKQKRVKGKSAAAAEDEAKGGDGTIPAEVLAKAKKQVGELANMAAAMIAREDAAMARLEEAAQQILARQGQQQQARTSG